MKDETRNSEYESHSLVIELDNFFYSYNNSDWALQDVNVEINEKQFIGVIGPNGGGKTTFLKLILGLIVPNKGRIRLFGQSVKKGRKLFGYFPQIKDLDQDFPISVYEIILGARLEDRLVNFYSKKDHLVVEKVIQTLDITDLRDRKLNELSGGQRNRVFLARALACEPQVLILDEPMAGLDVKLQKMFMDTLKSLNKTITIVIVDHNVSLLKDYVDEILCMNRCIAHGVHMHTKDKFTDILAEDLGKIQES
jgi:zinc transport system ATP-binding protein